MTRALLSLWLGFSITTAALAGGTYNWPAPPPPANANLAAIPAFPLGGWFDYFSKNVARARKMDEIDVIFDGDQWSICNGGYGPIGGMYNHFSKYPAFDFGNRGDATETLLWRLQQGQVAGLDPKLVVLEIGGSNPTMQTPEQVADGIKADVAEYQKRCPNATILLMGVFPRGDKPTDPARARINAINQIISGLGDGKKVIYIDCGDKLLLPDGTQNKDCFYGGGSITGKGYDIWADAIAPTITQMLPQLQNVSAAAKGNVNTAGLPPLGGTITWPAPPLPPGANPATTPAPPIERLDQFQKRIDDSRKQKSVDLVFDGDSITAGWLGGGGAIWGRKYMKLNAVDFGVPGDVTQGLLWRVDNGQVDGLHPKLIVLLIGTNNLGRFSAEQIAEGIKVDITAYQKHIPGCPILLQGIFPRSASATDPIRAKIKAINAIISKFGDGKNVIYLDFGDKFLQPDGTLSRDLFPDLLHPNLRGYEIWNENISPVIEQFFPGSSQLYTPKPATPPSPSASTAPASATSNNATPTTTNAK